MLPADGVVPGPSDVATIVSIRKARIAATGAVDATVHAEGSDRIIVTLPGITDPEPFRTFIGQIGQVDFVPLGQTQVTAGETLDPSTFPPLFGGDEIASASVGVDQNGQPAIDFVLDPDGTRLFADYTAKNIGSSFAITVDGAVLTAPIHPQRHPWRGGPDHRRGRRRLRRERGDENCGDPAVRSAAVPDPRGRP